MKCKMNYSAVKSVQQDQKQINMLIMATPANASLIKARRDTACKKNNQMKTLFKLNWK